MWSVISYNPVTEQMAISWKDRRTLTLMQLSFGRWTRLFDARTVSEVERIVGAWTGKDTR
jgi:hypothetical protein